MPGLLSRTLRTTEPLLPVHAAPAGGDVVGGAVRHGGGQRSQPDLQRRALRHPHRVRVRGLLHPDRLLATVLLHEVREILNYRIERETKISMKEPNEIKTLEISTAMYVFFFLVNRIDSVRSSSSSASFLSSSAFCSVLSLSSSVEGRLVQETNLIIKP